MRKIVQVLFVIAIIGCNQETSSEKTTLISDQDEQIVKELMANLWNNVYVEKDVAQLDILLHPDFRLVDDAGSVLNKEDEISYVGSQGDAYENFSYEISSINLFENGTAIAYTDCRLSGVDLDGAYVTTYFQSCTMVKIENEWKVVGYHVSGVKDERIENAPTE